MPSRRSCRRPDPLAGTGRGGLLPLRPRGRHGEVPAAGRHPSRRPLRPPPYRCRVMEPRGGRARSWGMARGRARHEHPGGSVGTRRRHRSCRSLGPPSVTHTPSGSIRPTDDRSQQEQVWSPPTLMGLVTTPEVPICALARACGRSREVPIVHRGFTTIEQLRASNPTSSLVSTRPMQPSGRLPYSAHAGIRWSPEKPRPGVRCPQTPVNRQRGSTSKERPSRQRRTSKCR